VNAIDRAAYFDVHERPVEAAKAYEEAIRANCASLETYLNLAALYFVCQVGGYAAHHRLTEEFLNRAWNRFGQVLNEAEAKFGRDSEIAFWRRYVRFVVLGEDFSVQTAERIAKSGRSLIPYLHLVMWPGSTNYQGEAALLLESVRAGKTEKDRYIRSVLESVRSRRS
jgi:hypothetical protein